MPIGLKIALFVLSNIGTLYKSGKALIRLIEESGEDRKAMQTELVEGIKELIHGNPDRLNKLLSKLTESCDTSPNPSGVPPTNAS